MFQTITIIAIVSLVIFFLIILLKRKPRGFIPFKKRNFVDYSEYPNPINKDRYLSTKKPNQVETVIIGSGISGMSAASTLSRVGRSCIVLEHHYVAGGWTHQFKHNGYEFETGVHYFPKFNYLDPMDFVFYAPIEYSQLGLESKNKIYEKVYFQGEEYCVPSNVRLFIQELCEKFPHQQKEIKNFFNMKQMGPKGPLIYVTRMMSKLINSKFVTKMIYKLLIKDMKLSEAFEKYKITDFKLKSFLCYLGYLLENDDQVEMSQKVSYYIYLQTIFYLCEGTVFPLKGSEEIANRILPVIYRNGNKVLVNKKVEKILLNKTNDKVIGVEMENEEVIRCKNVISSIGISQTYEQLLPEQFQNDPDYQYFKKNTKYQKPGMLIFVALKGKASELKLPSYNIWHMPESGYQTNKETYKTLDDILKAKNVMYFVSSAAGKQYQNGDFDKCTLTVMALIGGNKNMFSKWENQSSNHRDQEYQDFKDKFAQKVLNEIVFRYLPQLQDKIDFTSVGTLLTVQNFMNSRDGNIYAISNTKNLDKDEKLYNFIKFKNNKIQGLYLTGQDIIGIGVQPNSLGGLLTASKILGYWTKWDILQGRLFFIDFWNLWRSDRTQYIKDSQIQNGNKKLN